MSCRQQTACRRGCPAALPATGRATEPAAVRLDQVDPGPEDQHHSNQHAVQLGFIHRGITGFYFQKSLGTPIENRARLA